MILKGANSSTLGRSVVSKMETTDFGLTSRPIDFAARENYFQVEEVLNMPDLAECEHLCILFIVKFT